MQDKILHKSGDLFLNYGVKSITMDDIAQQLGISKKTIYDYYNNKETLIKETTNYLFDNFTQELEQFFKKNESKNAIEVLFESYKFIRNLIKEEQAPEFQLKKYFPQVYESIQRRKYEFVINIIKNNLKNGIAQGYYRSDIEIEMISKFYYAGFNSIRDSDYFPNKQFKTSQVIFVYTKFHIRGIATPKGLKTLDKYLKNHEE